MCPSPEIGEIESVCCSRQMFQSITHRHSCSCLKLAMCLYHHAKKECAYHLAGPRVGQSRA